MVIEWFVVSSPTTRFHWTLEFVLEKHSLTNTSLPKGRGSSNLYCQPFYLESFPQHASCQLIDDLTYAWRYIEIHPQAQTSPFLELHEAKHGIE
jgi:hypothetical protein